MRQTPQLIAAEDAKRIGKSVACRASDGMVAKPQFGSRTGSVSLYLWARTYSLSTLPRKMWPFWRTGFYPDNQSDLKTFQKILND